MNKVNSKATLKWKIKESSLTKEIQERFRNAFASRINKEGFVVIQSDNFRDQERNTKECLHRLEILINKALIRPRFRKKTTPSRTSMQKRLDNKKENSRKKSLRKKINY